MISALSRTPSVPQIRVSMLPQDPLVSTPEDVWLPAEALGSQLRGPLLKTTDSIPVAQADADGNYVYAMDTPQFDQVNTHATVASAITTYERYMGHGLHWSFRGPMEVHPHAGEGKTAYYSRWDESINFCQWDSPSLGKVVKTSQAFDVASHETGHAILDGLRPGLLGGKEGKAFHEAFGDCSAILHALQFDSNLDKILAENGGDFSKPNLVSRLAEEFGTAFNKEDDNPNNDDHPYYRTALNDFKYVPMSQLPSDSYPPSQPEEVLTSEPHSFSRIWSGAFYSMLGSLFQECCKDNPNQKEALQSARDVLGSIWGRSLDQLPASNLKFRQPAMAMLREARRLEDGKYFDALAGVMVDRQLLTPEEVQQAQQKSPIQTLFPAGYDWQAQPAQQGADGRQVLTYLAPQTTEVDLGSLGRAVMERTSGLTLVFNRQGQLESQVFTPLEPADLADARQEAAELAAAGRISQPGLVDNEARARLIPQREGLPLLQLLPIWD